MIEIIQERDVTWETVYDIFFGYVGHERSWGFGFDCDRNGTVDTSKLNPAAHANYLACLTGTVHGRKVIGGVIRSNEVRHITERIGKCPCGERITLSHFTNTCSCGRDYNSSGTELAPRSQWGEETGETYADIAHL